MLRSLRSAPRGRRVPCSQLRIVFAPTLRNPAKTTWLALSECRISRMSRGRILGAQKAGQSHEDQSPRLVRSRAPPEAIRADPQVSSLLFSPSWCALALAFASRRGRLLGGRSSCRHHSSAGFWRGRHKKFLSLRAAHEHRVLLQWPNAAFSTKTERYAVYIGHLDASVPNIIKHTQVFQIAQDTRGAFFEMRRQ